jgi:hypothetical protein
MFTLTGDTARCVHGVTNQRGNEMQLGQKQRQFTKYVGKLIRFAYANGYEISLGDAYATSGHIKGSFHGKRLAIDLNLFKDSTYLTKTEDHEPLGAYWRSLHPNCTWGGDFDSKDGNHYSFGEK